MVYGDEQLHSELEEYLGHRSTWPTYMLTEVLTVSRIRDISYVNRVRLVTFIFINGIHPSIVWEIMLRCGVSLKKLNKCKALYNDIKQAPYYSRYRTEYFSFDLIQGVYTDMNGNPRTSRNKNVTTVNNRPGVSKGNSLQMDVQEPDQQATEEQGVTYTVEQLVNITGHQEEATVVPKSEPDTETVVRETVTDMLAVVQEQVESAEQNKELLALEELGLAGMFDSPIKLPVTTQAEAKSLVPVSTPLSVSVPSKSKSKKTLFSPISRPKSAVTSRPIPSASTPSTSGHSCRSTVQSASSVVCVCGFPTNTVWVTSCRSKFVIKFTRVECLESTFEVGATSVTVQCGSCTPVLYKAGACHTLCGDISDRFELLVTFCKAPKKIMVYKKSVAHCVEKKKST